MRVNAVTDPQGYGDLNTGQLTLFDALSGGKREMHTFDIETYGIFSKGGYYAAYFTGSSGAAARSTFCDAEWWPAEVTVADASGHVTKAKIGIPIMR